MERETYTKPMCDINLSVQVSFKAIYDFNVNNVLVLHILFFSFSQKITMSYIKQWNVIFKST